MPTDIGPRIGIDGEAEFRKQLSNINQQLRTLGSEMQAVTSAFDAGDRSQEKLSAQSEVLTRQIEAQEQKLQQLQKGLDAAAEKYGVNDTRTLKWAQTVNRATADLNKMRAQLRDTERGLEDVGSGSEDAARAIDEAGEAAGQSEGKFGTLTVAMGNLVSSGIQAAVSAVGDLVGALVNLDENTEEYRIAQGRLQTAYEAAGYSADTAQQAYTALYGILGDTGTATEAGQLLAKLARSEEDVATWTGIAAGVSGTFGDSLPIESLIEAANETAKVGEVTGTLADALNWAGVSEDGFNTALAACSGESERNQLIMDTLSETYDTASDAFYRNNEALVRARENQAAMDAVLGDLGGTIAEVKNRLAGEFTPALAGVVEGFNGLLTGAPGAGEALSQAIGALAGKAAERLPELLRAGAELAAALAGGLISALPELLNAGLALLEELARGIREGIPALVNALPEVLSGILDYLTERLPNLLAAGKHLLQSLTQGLLEAVPDLVERLPELITAVTDFIAENLPVIVQTGVELLMSLVSGLLQAVPDLVAALPKVITALAEGVIALQDAVFEAGVQLLESLWEGIQDWIPELVGHIPEIITSIVEALAAGLSAVTGIGRNIVEGIWEGISGAAGWLGDQVSGFMSGLVDDIKRFFGIASPSRLFEDEVGRYLAQGIGVGFADEMRAVSARMQQAVPTPTVGDLQTTAAGLVNGMQTALTGGGPQPATIVLQLGNGRELARWLLSDLRAVEKSSPEVLSGV